MNAALQPTREFDDAIAQREQRVVSTSADTLAGMDVGAVLTDDDRPGADFLAGESLDAEALCLRVTAVPGRTETFLVCHFLRSLPYAYSADATVSATASSDFLVLRAFFGAADTSVMRTRVRSCR